jgi:hypothetical protein
MDYLLSIEVSLRAKRVNLSVFSIFDSMEKDLIRMSDVSVMAPFKLLLFPHRGTW